VSLTKIQIRDVSNNVNGKWAQAEAVS
jgi:hypothetical protein